MSKSVTIAYPPASPFIASFIRRQGRALTARRRCLLEEALPRVRVVLPEEARAGEEGISLAALRVGMRERPVWMEIGFGAGEHLAALARRYPETLMLGCEPHMQGVASLLAAMEQDGLDNIRMHTGDARLLLLHLPDASLTRLIIPFPDPWPKARHHKRRLIQPETLDLFAAKLAPGAELRFVTDDAAYMAWSLERLLAHPAFHWMARCRQDWRTPPADWTPTRYQKKAEKAGRDIFFLRFRRGEGEGFGME